MWFFKLLLLIAMIASWIPSVRSQDDTSHHRYYSSNEQPEPEEEEENEELAA
ncbi:hypothetical protein [Peredibacter starrii]|uniref:Uncharacterized protein n=1 Tax=Peredibacter starrii TaxID=28202 RepID=A0AAX4HUR2_9BACT|nr:hypothetical protein [Peredibacter starrii]WPU66997.1 hypothetical protein SOO65_09560 [Peredibacter starrii]